MPPKKRVRVEYAKTRVVCLVCTYTNYETFMVTIPLHKLLEKCPNILQIDKIMLYDSMDSSDEHIAFSQILDDMYMNGILKDFLRHPNVDVEEIVKIFVLSFG